MANRNVARIPRVCTHCKIDFTVSPSVLRNANGGLFCSRVCKDAANRANGSVLKCEQCGCEFKATRSDIKRGRKLCSAKCRAVNNSRPIEGRFWEKVEKTDSCWLWTGAINGNGYGVFRVNSQNIPAHRFSLEIAQGHALNAELQACHHCDNPPCVRPDHLFAGTRKDNMQDCVQKGRQSCKLNPEKVKQIRQRHSQGESARLLGDEYCVDKSMIHLIIKRRYWVHVD